MKLFMAINSLSALITLLSVLGLRVFLCRAYPREDLMVYFALMDALNWILLLWTGFKDAGARALHSGESQEAAAGMVSRDSVALYLPTVLAVMPLTYYAYLRPSLGLSTVGLPAIQALLFLLVINLLFSNLFQAARFYAIVAVLELVRTTSTLVAVGVLWHCFKFTSGHVLLVVASLIGNMTFLILQFFRLRQLGPELSPLRAWRAPPVGDKQAAEIRRETFLATLDYIVGSVHLYFSGLILVIGFSSSEAADYLVVARPLYMALLAVFSQPVFRFFFPELVHLVAQRDIEKIRALKSNFMRACWLGGSILVGLVFLLSDRMIAILFTQRFESASPMFKLLLVSVPFCVYTQYPFAFIKACGGFRATLSIRWFGVFVFGGVILVARSWVGVVAVPLSMVVSALGVCAYAIIVENRMMKTFIRTDG